MGIFSRPKCPDCGGKVTPTGYAFPYPQYRCDHCVKVNRQNRKDQNEIQLLKARIEKLEKKQKEL